ncbi:MAG: hypothetical protein HOK71_04810 [Planctomycetaceae bacterium]|nr:hypothetical protein [Planctomycetaceae bacterium]MBT6483980.1 hypothetical protein [Planctomycetaceae bacterium]
MKDKTDFLLPEVAQGAGDIRYFPFLRVGSKGPWAGVNNYGVSFVAADNYLAFNETVGNSIRAVDQDIFAACTKIISDFKTAEGAKEYMVDFYKGFDSPDILLVTDSTSAYFIESFNGNIECIERTEQFFASTNHMRMLYGGVPYGQNHSTYLRLARAEEILQKNSDATGVLNLLRDQYYGDSVFSICRVDRSPPPQEQPYYTQATAIMYANETTVNCVYQINGNPRTNPYSSVIDIFGTAQMKTGVASLPDLVRLLTLKP